MVNRKGRRNLLINIVLAFAVCLKSFAQAVNFPPTAASDSTTTIEDTAVSLNVVANDSDPDGNLNTSSVDLDVMIMGIQGTATTPQGSYSVDADGIVTFTPAPGFHGIANRQYNVSDSLNEVSNNTNIRVTVSSVNAAPVAGDDNATTDVNKEVRFNLLANDSDSDGELDTSAVDLNPGAPGIQKSRNNAQGEWKVDRGEMRFKPEDDFVGTATLTYTVRDNEGETSNIATITITVNGPQNVAPVAANDTGATTQGTAVSVNVVANDTDSDGTIDATKVDLSTTTAGIQNTATTPQGSWSVNAAGVVTYTSAVSFAGAATLDYFVSDDSGAVSNAATITINVTVANVAPIAVNDNGATTQDKPVTVNVVANDTDSDGTIDATKVDLNTAAAGVQNTITTAQGTWAVNAAGVVTYTPAATFVGSATQNYTVPDDDGAVSNAATITVSVTIGNAQPVAVNDNGATTLNKPVTINVVANDTDSDGTIDVSKVDLNTTLAGIQNTANTAQGSWSVNATGIVTYTPIALFLGSATLSYFVSDNGGAVSNAATITITVQAVNLPPTAINDNTTTTKNKAVSIKVTDNDTDLDGTIAVATVDLNPTLAGTQTTSNTDQGSYSVNLTGVVTYTPALNFTGVAAQQYNVKDNTGATSNTATLSITVQNVNSAPVAADDDAVTSQNIAVTINVVSNDTDNDGVIDAAKVDLNTTTAGIQNTNTVTQGTFAVNNIGVVTYTPAKDFTGSVTLNYTVSDNNGAVSNAAKIVVAVQPVNAPIANEDRATTLANQSVDINVVANDRDADGTIDAATVDLNATAAGIQTTITTTEGTFAVVSSGIVRFTPRKDFFGTATTKYTVKDNKGVLSNAASIDVMVQAVPDVAPEITAFEAVSDTLRYTPGTPIQLTGEFDVKDQDDDSLAVAEIGFVTLTYATGFDQLLFDETTNIRGTFNLATGLLTLTGLAPIEEYVEAVRSVQYNFTGQDEFHDNIKRVYVRLSDGNEFSDLKERAIRVNSALTELDIPTAFTPNNDGANDTWRILTPADISGSDFASAEIKVYDKRGTVVFGVNGLANAWDGTYQGKQLPVDTYYYIIDLKQKQKRYRGVVAILR